MSDVNQMTRAELEEVPERERFDQTVRCMGIIILPERRKHNSGFRCMDFVAINERNEPICRLSGCSDVLHLDGIGGFGYRWIEKGGVPSYVRVAGWQMDCLPKSGLLRLWPSAPKIDLLCGAGFSSFDIFAVPKEGS